MSDGSERTQPPIVDVPVVTPAGGTFIIYCPVAAGDNVVLHFAERGIELFKATFAEAQPGPFKFALSNAIATPGFGPLNITPAANGGLCVQTTDGSTALIVETSQITMKQSSRSVVVTSSGTTITGDLTVSGDLDVDGSLQVDGSSFKHGSKNVGKSHRHAATKPGSPAEQSGPPA